MSFRSTERQTPRTPCAPATSGSRARGSSATSTTTCCRPRSSPHSSASRPCPLAINPNSDQYLEERLQLLDEQLATVTRPAKDNELPDAILTESGLKNHPAGCGGAGSGAGADRPNQPVTAAHQDHRTADGRGRLDGLQPPLHPLEGRGRGQRQDVAAVRNPR